MVQGTARAQTDGAPDTERYTLRAEVGLEYDTNAHRTEMVAGANNPPIVASPLERLVLAGTLSDLVAEGQLLTLAATAAGKIYDAPAAYGEDVAIAQSSIAWAKALGRRATLTLSGAYYEAFQSGRQESGRRQRTTRLSLAGIERPARMDRGASTSTCRSTPATEAFCSSPIATTTSTRPTAAAELRWTRQTSDADWEVSTGAAFEHRIFGGPALAIDCPGEIAARTGCSPARAPSTRHDEFLMSHLELLRVGRVLLGGRLRLPPQPFEQLRRDGDAPHRDRPLRRPAAGSVSPWPRAASCCWPSTARAIPIVGHGRRREQLLQRREHRGREPLQRAGRPVARAGRTACVWSRATPSTPTSSATPRRSATSARRCCCR